MLSRRNLLSASRVRSATGGRGPGAPIGGAAALGQREGHSHQRQGDHQDLGIAEVVFEEAGHEERDDGSQRAKHQRAVARGVGGEAQETGPTAGGEGSPEWWADMKAKGPGDNINFTNWPAYIDISDDGSTNPSIDAFKEETGLDVEYDEGLLDNADFLSQYAPDLRAGNNTGWDIMSPGGWVVERMARNGWLEELDHSKLPNWTAINEVMYGFAASLKDKPFERV